MASQLPQSFILSYSFVAEEHEARLQMDLGHSFPRLLIEHYRVSITLTDAGESWKRSPSV
jgi:hypothetical protein